MNNKLETLYYSRSALLSRESNSIGFSDNLREVKCPQMQVP
jgi:hypothetical protein